VGRGQKVGRRGKEKTFLDGDEMVIPSRIPSLRKGALKKGFSLFTGEELMNIKFSGACGRPGGDLRRQFQRDLRRISRRPMVDTMGGKLLSDGRTSRNFKSEIGELERKEEIYRFSCTKKTSTLKRKFKTSRPAPDRGVTTEG